MGLNGGAWSATVARLERGCLPRARSAGDDRYRSRRGLRVAGRAGFRHAKLAVTTALARALSGVCGPWGPPRHPHGLALVRGQLDLRHILQGGPHQGVQAGQGGRRRRRGGGAPGLDAAGNAPGNSFLRGRGRAGRPAGCENEATAERGGR